MVNHPDAILEWLPVPDVAERTGATFQQVKRWIQERELVAIRRGERQVLVVPSTFLAEDGPLPHLRGTLTVLADGGMSEEEIIDWLHAEDPSLPGGSPIGSLRAGSKTEVRRRAQEHAF